MNDKTAICNKALFLIGEAHLISLDDASKQARLCNHFWDNARDFIQRAYAWNICIQRASLAQLSTTPEFGFDYEYQLPTNPYCLRVLETNPDNVTFKIEGRKLLTDEDEIGIRYIARNDDVGNWPAELKEAVAAKIAAELAMPMTNNRNLADQMVKLYQEILAKAQDIDAQEEDPDALDDTDYGWLNAR